MTQFPEDEERLVKFVRRHAGAPPPAAANLEVQIMQAVESLPHRQTPRRGHLWIVPPALAASLVVAFGAFHFLNPPSKNNNVEEFMTDNWDGVITGDTTEADFLSVN